MDAIVCVFGGEGRSCASIEGKGCEDDKGCRSRGGWVGASLGERA